MTRGPLYHLDTVPWQCYTFPPYTPWRHAFDNGRLAGTTGPGHRLPVYANHTAARRAILEGNYPMTAIRERPSLSVANVLDLRVSARTHVYDGTTGQSRYAIGYNAAADVYELRASPISPPMCSHADINVLAALLRGERFEDGFIAKVLSSQYAPDEIALDADAREQLRRDREAHDASARARKREAEDRARAQRALMPAQDAPEGLSLDDLFSDL